MLNRIDGINSYIVGCKDSSGVVMRLLLSRINSYIVGCKEKDQILKGAQALGINSYIVGCKVTADFVTT